MKHLYMTDNEVLQTLKKGSDSRLNRARSAFSSEMGKIEQASVQRHSLPPIELRRMEFNAVRKIAEILGVEI